jgi:mRNA interferase RelE/StbE
MYKLLFTHNFNEQFCKLDKAVRDRIAKRIRLLKDNPEHGQHIKGLKLWKLRVGKYRIINSIERDRLLIILLDVGHRKHIYRGY